MPHRCWPWLLGLLGLLAGAGCDETGVILRLRYGLRVPEQLDGLCLQIAAGDRLQFARHYDLSEASAGKPATLSVAQGESEGFEVMLRALRRGWTVSFERAELKFAPHEQLEQTIPVPGCRVRARGQTSFARQALRASLPTSALAALPLHGNALALVAFAPGTAQLLFWRPGSEPTEVSGALPRPPSGSIRQVIAADLDQDCAQDLVILTDSGVTVWRQRAEGEFEEIEGALRAGADLRGGVAARIDDDALTDLVIVSGTSVLLYLNQPGSPGRFSDGLPIAGGAESIATGIADTDRFPDLVLTHSSEVTQILHRQQDVGSAFEAKPLADARGAGLAVLADLDGQDRIDELILARADEIAIYRREPRAGADYAAAVTLKAPGTVRAMLTADLNADCRPDLLLATSQGLALSINEEGQLSSPAVIDPALTEASQVAVGDPDGDGRSDLLLGGDPAGLVWLRQSP